MEKSLAALMSICRPSLAANSDEEKRAPRRATRRSSLRAARLNMFIYTELQRITRGQATHPDAFAHVLFALTRSRTLQALWLRGEPSDLAAASVYINTAWRHQRRASV